MHYGPVAFCFHRIQEGIQRGGRDNATVITWNSKPMKPISAKLVLKLSTTTTALVESHETSSLGWLSSAGGRILKRENHKGTVRIEGPTLRVGRIEKR